VSGKLLFISYETGIKVRVAAVELEPIIKPVFRTVFISEKSTITPVMAVLVSGGSRKSGG
jgi:hypothetical protein